MQKGLPTSEEDIQNLKDTIQKQIEEELVKTEDLFQKFEECNKITIEITQSLNFQHSQAEIEGQNRKAKQPNNNRNIN